MLVCPGCRGNNPEDATFCEACDYDLLPGRMSHSVRSETLQQQADDIELKPFRKRKSDVGFFLGLSLVGLLVIGAVQVVINDPAPAVTAPSRSEPPAESFGPATLRTMARSGAVSLAKNLANGNTEVVQALLSGPISISAATDCRVTAIVAPIFPDARATRAFRAKYAVDLANARRAVNPRAEGKATAQVPAIVPPLHALGPNGEDLEATAVRVTVLLHDCGKG